MASVVHRKGKIIKKSYSQEVRQAAERANNIARGITNDDDDTDSVASSASSFNAVTQRRKKGVSPLNRRRSLRLAIKNAMETEDGSIPQTALVKEQTNNWLLRKQLLGQETVEMMSPLPKLERMETSTRWNYYRDKKPMLSTEDTIGTKKRIVQRMDTTPDLGPKIKRNTFTAQSDVGKRISSKRSFGTLKTIDEHDSKKPAILKKKSTTWGLRQMFDDTALEDTPNEAAQEAAAGVLNVGHRATLKRKATVLKSPPVSQSAPRKSALLQKKSTVKKSVRVLTPHEEDTTDDNHTFAVGPQQMKRQVTLGVADGWSPKTKRRKGSVERQKSKVDSPEIYIPAREEWPVNLPSQIVWSVPIIGSLGSAINGYAVHVDPKRCLIGDEEGKVIELNEAVVPTKIYEVPYGVKCIVPDGEFIYIGCDNGGLYDITHGEPRLVTHCRGFGQVYAMDVFQGLMAASDSHGNVALINHNGIMWKRKSDGEFGWMVQIDDTGVYHGHSRGVTKYSLLDGKPVWLMKTEDSVLHGVQKPDAIYVASGAKVFKLDKITGAILRTYSKGKSSTRSLHSNAVGGGIVFAGGNKIVCYDEETGDVVYVLNHPFNPASMRYYSGRLFCVGKGSMSVLEFTEAAIGNAQRGINLQTTEVTPDPKAPKYTPQVHFNTVSAKDATKQGVVIEFVRPSNRRGKLLARTRSKKYNDSWDIQVPEDLSCKEGQKFVVQDLKASDSGGFYRIFGQIHAIE